MKLPIKIIGLAIALTFSHLFTGKVQGQIIPDNTVDSVVETEAENSLLITGGAVRGENLFHSFSELNVREIEEVYFANPEAVINIFSRVTGNNPSQILGTLGVRGGANLYLINSNGVIFGPNAFLDVGGSFLATTANRILFADGAEFKTNIGPQETPLLTISVPVGLVFTGNNGPILNRSQLGVPSGEAIALVGGRISMRGSLIITESAQIELGSVERGIVSIEGFTLDYQEVESFGDITLTESSEIFNEGETTGNIQIQGRNISLGSTFISNVTYQRPAGDILVKASNNITLSEVSGIFNEGKATGDIQLEARNIFIADSQIGTLTERGPVGDIMLTASNAIKISGYIGDGIISGIVGTLGEKVSRDNGVIRVEAKTLSLTDGSQILGDNYSDRPGLDVIINIDNSINILGNSSDNFLPSAIFSASNSNGDAGNLTINTGRLNLKDGANVSSSTFAGTGKAGDLTINATEAIKLTGSNINDLGEEVLTGIFAQVEVDSNGDAGNLTIRTNQLTLETGAQISTSTKNQGQGGDIVIEAGEFVHLRGTSPNADLVLGQSGIFVSAEKSEREGREILLSTGDGGNLFLKTGELTITEGAKISADTFGLGKGGDIQLEVDNLIISEGGSLRAGSFVEENSVTPGSDRGDGGTITIKATELVRVTRSGTSGEINPISIDSNITSESQGTGNAGSIEIISPRVFVDNNGQVSVSNSGEGEGGNLAITSNSVELSQGLISAETGGNQGGNVTLQVADTLSMERESQITATAGVETGSGDGGNITIDTDFLVAIPQENNDIVANASLGRGGNIQITAEGILGITPRPELTPLSDITASSEFGIDGTISINTPDTDPTTAAIELSDQVIDIEWLRAQNPCSVEDDSIARGSSFVITGRGGLPPSSQDAIPGKQRIVGWQSPVILKSRENEETPTPVQANGWIVTPDGTIHLTQNDVCSPPSP